MQYITGRITASFRLGLPSPLGSSQRFGLVVYHQESNALARGWQVGVGER